MNKPDKYLQEKIDSFTKTHKGEDPEEILADMRGKNLITDAMTANEAPEKIYFTQTENGTHYYTEGIPFERNYIEYTRTDALIEKACGFIAGNMNRDGYTLQAKAKFINEFKNYMKG